MVTDPYCPLIWPTPSNDTPHVVESDHNLPTRGEKFSHITHPEASQSKNENKRKDLHKDTIHKILEPLVFL